MSAINFSKMAKNSYKALCFVQHIQLQKKNIYRLLPTQLNNKIIMFPNLHSLRMNQIDHLHLKSMVIYKFDNGKISNIQFDKENNIFTADYIDGKAIIKYKEIYFDVNKVSEYYRDLENLEKYFETN